MSTTRLLDEVKRHRKAIKHEVLTYALSEIAAMHAAEPQEMEIQPDWQRLFRWTREQQSAFIESLILEIPIPPLFFFENDDGRWELLDGLQRVSTILKFMGTNQDVPSPQQGADANHDEWHYTHENDIEQPLQLVATDYLPSLEGLSFYRLPTPLRLNLKRARVQIYVLKRETDRIYKYEVFKRLNRGGSVLEEQELRNCAVRILDDVFPAFIKKLGGNSDFRRCIGISQKRLDKGYADELGLRYLTMKNYGDRFRHDVAGLLTHYMEQVAAGQLAFDYENEEKIFDKVWETLGEIRGIERLFRGRRKKDGASVGSLSPTYFEIVSLWVAWHAEEVEELTPDLLEQVLKGLLEKAVDERVTGAGSNSKVKTAGRLDLARRWSVADAGV